MKRQTFALAALMLMLGGAGRVAVAQPPLFLPYCFLVNGGVQCGVKCESGSHEVPGGCETSAPQMREIIIHLVCTNRDEVCTICDDQGCVSVDIDHEPDVRDESGSHNVPGGVDLPDIIKMIIDIIRDIIDIDLGDIIDIDLGDIIVIDEVILVGTDFYPSQLKSGGHALPSPVLQLDMTQVGTFSSLDITTYLLPANVMNRTSVNLILDGKLVDSFFVPPNGEPAEQGFHVHRSSVLMSGRRAAEDSHTLEAEVIDSETGEVLELISVDFEVSGTTLILME